MKAVIVIDVPDGIDLSLVEGMLTVTSKDVRKLFMAETYQDLELKPLPQKEKVNTDSSAEFKTIDEAWTQGYNACLDEITGDCGDACKLKY